PDANTTCQGWMFEFDGACWARLRASSTNSRGTGLSRKNIRVVWRSLIAVSRSIMVTLLQRGLHHAMRSGHDPRSPLNVISPRFIHPIVTLLARTPERPCP